MFVVDLWLLKQVPADDALLRNMDGIKAMSHSTTFFVSFSPIWVHDDAIFKKEREGTAGLSQNESCRHVTR